MPNISAPDNQKPTLRRRSRPRRYRASSATTIASLPPISATTRLIQICPGRVFAASSLMCRPTPLEPVNEINRVFGCVTIASPVSELPADEVNDAWRKPGFLDDLHKFRRDRRRIGRWLEDDGITRDDGGHRHSGHDRERKIPRRNDRTNAKRNIFKAVSSRRDKV